MTTPTTPGRWLARAAGLLSAAAAVYVLTEDALRSGRWTSDDLLMPVLVTLTILASHLVGSARRARAPLAPAGFLLLAVVGTGLIVYTSVGRQARLADTEDAAAADAAQRRGAVEAEIAATLAKRAQAEAMLDAARRTLAAECQSGKGSRCRGTEATADVYAAAVKGRDVDLARLRDELARLGPAPVSASRAQRMAAAVAVFAGGDDEERVRARLARVFRLFEPFAFSLFWELGAVVALGYGFGHGRRQRVPVSATAAIVSTRDSRQTSFPGLDAAAHDLAKPLPEPPGSGPEGGNGRRKPSPGNVVAFPRPASSETVAGHPVIVALEAAGGSVASARELARLMGCSPGEASKRLREVADALVLVREGRELRIGLAAGCRPAATRATNTA